MSSLSSAYRWFLLAALWFWSTASWAGSCPLCKEAAKSLGDNGRQALNWGILMLLFPPVAALATIIGIVAYRSKLETAALEATTSGPRPILPIDKRLK